MQYMKVAVPNIFTSIVNLSYCQSHLRFATISFEFAAIRVC